MKILVNKEKAWILFLYIILATIFLYLWFDIPSIYFANYGILFLAYLIVGGIFFVGIASEKVKLFDTFTIVSMLYIMIMVIYPIYDYIRLELTKSGVDTSSGCIKATIIFLISYISFSCGYFRVKTHEQESQSSFIRNIESISISEMYIIAISCWCVAYVGCMVGQVSRGFSLSYIFSMGKNVQDDIMITSSSGGLLFLLMLTPTVIVSELMIWIYGKSILVKTSTLILTMIYLLMRGSRILIFVMIAAPVVYWYLKRKKSPSIKTIIVGFFALTIIFMGVQIARVSISRGRDFRQALSEQIFSMDAIMALFESDFSTYKVFYGIVNAIPEKMDYLLGEGIFGYTLALVVPRAIWPGKPDAPERTVVNAALGQLAVDNGNAYPNIGTFYSEFGVIGCIIFMYIYGYLISKARKLYKMESKSALILYSCLWPFCFQLTARSVSNAVYSLFFGMLPMIVAWFYSGLVHKKSIGVGK